MLAGSAARSSDEDTLSRTDSIFVLNPMRPRQKAKSLIAGSRSAAISYIIIILILILHKLPYLVIDRDGKLLKLQIQKKKKKIS